MPGARWIDPLEIPDSFPVRRRLESVTEATATLSTSDRPSNNPKLSRESPSLEELASLGSTGCTNIDGGCPVQNII